MATGNRHLCSIRFSVNYRIKNRKKNCGNYHKSSPLYGGAEQAIWLSSYAEGWTGRCRAAVRSLEGPQF